MKLRLPETQVGFSIYQNGRIETFTRVKKFRLIVKHIPPKAFEKMRVARDVGKGERVRPDLKLPRISKRLVKRLCVGFEMRRSVRQAEAFPGWRHFQANGVSLDDKRKNLGLAASLLYKSFLELGIPPPMIHGWDADAELLGAIETKVPTIDIPSEEMARSFVKLLLRRLRSPAAPELSLSFAGKFLSSIRDKNPQN